jgi:hypothetical protein
MKLYDVPRNSTIVLEGGEELEFKHIDGMYSYCVTKEGNVVHLAAWSDVQVKEPAHEPR